MKVFPRERKQFFGVFFGDRRRELAGMDEFELRCLLGHRRGDFWHAVADEVDGRRSGEIEIFIAVGVPDVDAFAANGGRGNLCGKIGGKRRNGMAWAWRMPLLDYRIRSKSDVALGKSKDFNRRGRRRKAAEFAENLDMKLDILRSSWYI